MRRLIALLAGVAALSLAAFAGTASAAQVNLITLAANHSSVAVGQSVTFTGAYTTNGNGHTNATIQIIYWSGASCTPTDEYNVLSGTLTTNSSGVFAVSIYANSAGTYSFEAVTSLGNKDELRSACVTVKWANAAATLPPPENNVFLCYSASQTDPGVWPISEAAALIKAGYWSPYAVPGTVSGGTNVGGYHLVCNLATGQSAGTSVLGGAGEVYGTGATNDVTNVPGHYKVVGP
jgi:hypothetical protein